MKAWAITRQAPAAERAMELIEIDDPSPRPDELVVRVEACGVCRTDLHILEGDLPLKAHPTIPGHEIVGRVVARGESARRFEIGSRVGIAWLRRTCATCRYCRYGAENLCESPKFTGWDEPGGYAEYAVVPESFAYPLDPERPASELAPLLCAGIIGFRALKVCELPEGGALGIYGFGASAHITAQVALARGARVHVITRAEKGRHLALELGCHSAGSPGDSPPEPLDSAIVFAPAGEVVLDALSGLRRGGTCVTAGIYLSPIPEMEYQRHLFFERKLRSVTANTRRDGEEFMSIARQVPLRLSVTTYPFDEAPRALEDLAADRVEGVAVIKVT